MNHHIPPLKNHRAVRTGRSRRLFVPLVAVLGLVGSLGSALVLADPAAAATTLFVSATGSDTNPCTATDPCATITQALSLASSGDTIEVAGHISDAVTVNTTITVEQWPGQTTAVVDASQQSGRSVFEIDSGGLTLDGITVTGGTALTGAGIDMEPSTSITVIHSTISGNTATVPPNFPRGAGAIGGGIVSRSPGTVTITDSTIADNTAQGDNSSGPFPGDGGRGGGISNLGTMTITNSTITGNTAAAGSDSGGVAGGIDSDFGSATITDSTITDNTAAAEPSGGGTGGGIFAPASTTIGASIVANNVASGNPATNNCDDSTTSVGYNLTDDADGSACGFTQGTDEVNVDPALGPLADNGGPTQTQLPASTSPAVGVIPSPTTLNGVPVCGVGAFDQRGVPRPTGSSTCSIGAVEVPPPTGQPPTVTSANSTTFDAGAKGSFNVTTSGVPTPALSVSTGSGQTGLPAGVGFTDNADGTGTLSGTASSPGTFTFTITASNGVLPDATQDFTLVVQAAPATTTYGGSTLAVLPNASGYWIVHSDGGVFTYGTAPFFGSMGGKPLNAPMVGIGATPDGKGYWLVGSDGGVFTFGDARFFGSMGSKHLNAPVVGIVSTPDGGGYWLVASDGGVFTFGDAGFFGSMGGKHLNAPVVGMASTPDGGGYWLVGSDGGVFTFGDAGFFGSMGGKHLNAPIAGITSTLGGKGYWLVGSDGGVFTFGDAGFFGSLGGTPLSSSVIGLFSTEGGQRYTLVDANGSAKAF